MEKLSELGIKGLMWDLYIRVEGWFRTSEGLRLYNRMCNMKSMDKIESTPCCWYEAFDQGKTQLSLDIFLSKFNLLELDLVRLESLFNSL